MLGSEVDSDGVEVGAEVLGSEVGAEGAVGSSGVTDGSGASGSSGTRKEGL